MTHAAAPIPHAGDVITGKAPSSRRSARTQLTWAAIVAALALAVGLALMVLAGSTGTESVVPTAPAVPAEPGVPFSPDQAERYLADLQKLAPAAPREAPLAPSFTPPERYVPGS
ncbi:hypothetical protein ACFP3Q_05720 [Nocardioides sp. GCM10027113]|uniref:hypothetical protein n=1 Tax=unclassified Nocardioides TaxID=2615069 RepID=UPI0036197F3A